MNPADQSAFEDRACAWNPTRRELFWRWYVNKVKEPFKMWAHKWFWRTLWVTRLAIPYSRFMCRMGWYRKFLDGRCHWCGAKHG